MSDDHILRSASHSPLVITTVSHLWTIDNFYFHLSILAKQSEDAQKLQQISELKSATFPTEHTGIQWRLELYPNGNREANRGNVSVFLRCLPATSGDVDAGTPFLTQCKLSLLNGKDKEKYSGELKRTFEPGKAYGFGVFISQHVLRFRKKSLLPGDQLKLRCEITFMRFKVNHNTSTNPPPMPPAIRKAVSLPVVAKLIDIEPNEKKAEAEKTVEDQKKFAEEQILLLKELFSSGSCSNKEMAPTETGGTMMTID